MFGKCPPPIAKRVTRWGSDPFARMSYSYIKTGSHGGIDYDLMAAPNGQALYWVGEGTSREHPSTASGAFLSGLREAGRLCRDRGVWMDWPEDTEFGVVTALTKRFKDRAKAKASSGAGGGDADGDDDIVRLRGGSVDRHYLMSLIRFFGGVKGISDKVLWGTLAHTVMGWPMSATDAAHAFKTFCTKFVQQNNASA